jgi:hypothetical protein
MKEMKEKKPKIDRKTGLLNPSPQTLVHAPTPHQTHSFHQPNDLLRRCIISAWVMRLHSSIVRYRGHRQQLHSHLASPEKTSLVINLSCLFVRRHYLLHVPTLCAPVCNSWKGGQLDEHPEEYTSIYDPWTRTDFIISFEQFHFSLK